MVASDCRLIAAEQIQASISETISTNMNSNNDAKNRKLNTANRTVKRLFLSSAIKFKVNGVSRSYLDIYIYIYIYILHRS